MRLEDRHVFYPEEIHPDDVIAKITAILIRSPNNAILLNPALDLPNFIQRACWKAGVSPVIPLTALARERGILIEKADQDHDWSYACGVVGSDQPGTINHRWDGLLTQLLMCIELHAWYIGAGPDDNFGYRVGLEPHAVMRWPKQKVVQILNEKHLLVRAYNCENAAEYAQLTFTPHLGLGGPGDSNTLDVNGKILENYLSEFI